MKKSFTKFARGAAIIAVLGVTSANLMATQAHAGELPGGGVPDSVGYEGGGGCNGSPSCGGGSHGSTNTNASATANPTANASTGDVTVKSEGSAHPPSVYVGGAGECSSGWSVSFGLVGFGGGFGNHSPDKECLDQKTTAKVYETALAGGDVVVQGAALGALRMFDPRFNDSSSFVLKKIEDPACLAAAKNVSALVLTGDQPCGAYVVTVPPPVVKQQPVVRKHTPRTHHRPRPRPVVPTIPQPAQATCAQPATQPTYTLTPGQSVSVTCVGSGNGVPPAAPVPTTKPAAPAPAVN